MVKKTTRASRRKLKKPKLTTHQARVLKAKIEGDLAGKTQRQIAQGLWPNQTPHSAESSMSRVLNSADVNAAMAESLRKQEMDTDSLARVMKSAMQATKPMVLRDYAEELVYEQEAEGFDADPTDERKPALRTIIKEVPDHSIRMGAARTVATWMGIGKNPRPGDLDELPPPATTFNTQINQFIKK